MKSTIDFSPIYFAGDNISSLSTTYWWLQTENHAADIYEITRDFCTVDNRGHYCNDGVNLYTISYYAFESCPRTDVCEEGCLTALNNITAMVGCCYVSHFNRTGNSPLPAHLSYEFWQSCGLTSPGFCETRFVDVDLNNSASLLEKTITFTPTFYANPSPYIANMFLMHCKWSVFNCRPHKQHSAGN